MRDFIYTFIFNTLIGLVFTALALLFSDRIDLGRAALGHVRVRAVHRLHDLRADARASTPLVRRSPAQPAGTLDLLTVVPVVGVFVGYWIATTSSAFADSRAEMFTLRGVPSISAIARPDRAAC